ncbi:MAG: hypothetical protein IPL52_00315 [Flavobacteriales bacterium]|nr:hypothetical protein [Flavobacteriales bacterium]
MGGVNMGEAFNFTPLQMGRMHRNLMVANVAKFAWGFDPVPYTLSQNETWDFPIKFYQDIVVPAGVTLTLKCELHMVPEAKIVVQPGGRLIIDGGRARAALYSPGRWKGIEVQGTYNQNQLPATAPTYQGYLQVINGGKIADADIGVLVGNSQNGLTGGGGVVQTNDADFVNCATSVRFLPYHSSNPAYPWIYTANVSHFQDTRFVVNSSYMEYPGSLPFRSHVQLGYVHGIGFSDCHFYNSRVAQTCGELGHGIESFNSYFRVHNVSTFTGLDHAIHATGSTATSAFVAQDCIFRNNIAGVYANGLVNFKVRTCRVIMGERSVELTNVDEENWEGFHRGIFSTGSYAFLVRGNELEMYEDYLTEAEGIVIGYNYDGNDVVKGNSAVGVRRAFVGEGISSSLNPDYAPVMGLQFHCNTNSNNFINFWSRKIPGFDQDLHSIRGRQGDYQPAKPADNVFDEWPLSSTAPWDFHVTTTFTPIIYYHRQFDSYVPINYDGIFSTSLIDPAPDLACPTYPEPPGMAPSPAELKNELQDAKQDYAEVAYLFEDLLDGGNTNAVVLEIMSAWPQNAWELRNSLLSLSPFLTLEVLKRAMDSSVLPAAMKAEICIANPETTQRDNFMKWLENECLYPLGESMIASIVASWDVRTYRTSLEEQMAGHYTRYTESATLLADHYLTDTVSTPVDSLLWVWQQVRSIGARYAEANLLMEQHQYAAADDLVRDIVIEHRLKEVELAERTRMRAWIAFKEEVHLDGRSELELTSAEVAELEALILDQYDRPATWISNLLCYQYGLCRSPRTGGDDGITPKSLPVRPRVEVSTPSTATLTLQPNPANAWVAISYDLRKAPVKAELVVRDMLGRTVYQSVLAQQEGQTVWDTRSTPAGPYSVELREQGITLRILQLLVQP